ncbi:uncharacterized protein LOC125373050 [Haliotis rufescens]|uniref:uncharacterized protein LOC125373050 n=1 Tax=Haliotis rufescens TaxID=6454 RepID=UPI00201E8671|nr:uncharacterized protein LOC125373050 [Haliotis rufescens]
MAPRSDAEDLTLSGKADTSDSGIIHERIEDILTERPGTRRQLLLITGYNEHIFDTHRHSKDLYSDTYVDHMPTKECGVRYFLSDACTARSYLEQDSTGESVNLKQRAASEAQPCPETPKEKAHERSKGEQKSYENKYQCHKGTTNERVIRNSFSSNPIAELRDQKEIMNPSVHSTKHYKAPILETTDMNALTSLSLCGRNTLDTQISVKEERADKLQHSEEKKKYLLDAVHNAVRGVPGDTSDMDQPSLDERYKEFIKDLKYGSFYCMLERSYVTTPFISLHDYFTERATNEATAPDEEMRFEGLRLRSFHQVNMNVSYLRLAAAGFYATGNGDETRCFSCGVTHRNWLPKDNPHNLHSRKSPNCIHVTGTDARNVPIQMPAVIDGSHAPQVRNRSTPETRVSERDSNGSVPSELLGAVGTSRDSFSPPSYTTQQSGINCNDYIPASIPTTRFDSAVHPHYSNNALRLQSFQLWPEGHSQQPEDLVNAGFFYAGYSDCVRCYVCGVGLRTWEEGDDPWVEHVRWRSSCAYVEAARGMTFVIQTLAAIGRPMRAKPSHQHQQQSINNVKTPNSSEDDIIRTDACQEALRMGFSPKEVRSVAQATMRNGGTLDVLLENILAIDGDASGQTASAQGGDEVSIPQVQIQIGGKECAEGNMHSQPSVSTHKEVSRIQQQPLEKRHANANQDSGYMSDGEPQDARAPTQHAPHCVVTSPQTSERATMGYNNHTSEMISGNIVPSDQDGRDNDSKAAVNGFLNLPVTRQRKIGQRINEHEKNKDKLLATKKETQQLKESSVCKVCLEDPANIVFLPCGHLVACAECTPALDRCPVCRTHIRGTVRVHLADMASREKEIE